MTTIRDIAIQLGVSPSTVSRALNGSKEVSPDMQRRVQELARELNYTPNLLARSLVRSRTDTIGFLILEFANPFFIPVIQAIEDVVQARGYSVMISQSHRRVEDEVRVLKHFEMLQVSGVILTPTLEETEYLTGLYHGGMPVVVVGRTTPGLVCISIDNLKGGEMVGEHFLAGGHHSFGIVISGESTNEPERERLLGYASKLKAAGSELPDKWIFNVGRSGTKGGFIAAQRWLELDDRPGAVFCTTDRLAVGFIHALRREGVPLPGGVAVAGFDDIPFSEYLEVPPTTVAYPKYQLGELAAERLLQMIENPDPGMPSEHLLREPELIVRRSSGGK
jgi:LacI family transcriptional regulator